MFKNAYDIIIMPYQNRHQLGDQLDSDENRHQLVGELGTTANRSRLVGEFKSNRSQVGSEIR